MIIPQISYKAVSFHLISSSNCMILLNLNNFCILNDMIYMNISVPCYG